MTVLSTMIVGPNKSRDSLLSHCHVKSGESGTQALVVLTELLNHYTVYELLGAGHLQWVFTLLYFLVIAIWQVVTASITIWSPLSSTYIVQKLCVRCSIHNDWTWQLIDELWKESIFLRASTANFKSRGGGDRKKIFYKGLFIFTLARDRYSLFLQ
jgi:hypothetical protein